MICVVDLLLSWIRAYCNYIPESTVMFFYPKNSLTNFTCFGIKSFNLVFAGFISISCCLIGSNQEYIVLTFTWYSSASSWRVYDFLFSILTKIQTSLITVKCKGDTSSAIAPNTQGLLIFSTNFTTKTDDRFIHWFGMVF